MLGLTKGLVQVIPYQPDWPIRYEHERSILQQHLGHLVVDIQHVGSTAVPGLAAKPILDLAVALTSLAVIPACRAPLESLGYLDRGDAGGAGGYLFVKESTPAVRTHHLHLVTLDDPQWDNYVRFRDALRTDATLRAAYGALKQALQQQFAADRAGYTAAKAAFVQGVLERSRAR